MATKKPARAEVTKKPSRAKTPKRPLRSKGSFACEIDGTEYTINGGALYAPDHPAVKGREELFEAAEIVEEATAAPGERRKR